jgi:hypothetical protein
MPAVWTAPITWQVDQLVTEADLNEQLRDNLEYLLRPNHQQIIRNNGGNYTLTGVTTFQDIDSANLSLTLVTHGGPVWVHFQAVAYTLGTAHEGYFDLTVNGTRVGAAYSQGLATHVNDAGERTLVSLCLLLTGLSAGTHIIRPQWATSPSDTVHLLANSTQNPIILEAIEL